MALLTWKEFADKVGIRAKEINTYAKRKKIILAEHDDYIDDQHPINLEFYQNRYLKGKCPGAPQPKITQKTQTKVVMVEQITGEIPEVMQEVNEDLAEELEEGEGVVVENEEELGAWMNLDQERRRLVVLKLHRETQLLKIKIEQQKGILMPVEEAMGIMSRQNTNMVHEFNNSLDKIITTISKKKTLTLEESTAIRSEMIIEINSASAKSTDETIKEVKLIQQQLREKKK